MNIPLIGKGLSVAIVTLLLLSGSRVSAQLVDVRMHGIVNSLFGALPDPSIKLGSDFTYEMKFDLNQAAMLNSPTVRTYDLSSATVTVGNFTETFSGDQFNVFNNYDTNFGDAWWAVSTKLRPPGVYRSAEGLLRSPTDWSLIDSVNSPIAFADWAEFPFKTLRLFEYTLNVPLGTGVTYNWDVLATIDSVKVAPVPESSTFGAAGAATLFALALFARRKQLFSVRI